MDPINDLYQIIFISIFLTFGKFIYTIFDIGSEHFPLIKNFRPRLSSKETIYLCNRVQGYHLRMEHNQDEEG